MPAKATGAGKRLEIHAVLVKDVPSGFPKTAPNQKPLVAISEGLLI
jgi:hypothetical protein